VAAALVAQLGQLHRVALAGHEGPDNSQAGHAGDVADDVLELDVHLRQGLLHVLDVLAGIRYEHLALPQVWLKTINLQHSIGSRCPGGVLGSGT